MARTKEEIRNLVSQVMEHPNYDTLTLIIDDHICGELEVNTKKLLNAIIDDDIDGVINAFTGWDAEGLLFTHECSPLHRFVREPNPPKEGAPAHKPPADGQWKAEDYTWEYCPECDTDQVIYSKGVTACPNCGAPLAPCSCCEDGCDYSTCPYGCTGGEEDNYKAVTNPPISEDEQKWYADAIQNMLNEQASYGTEHLFTCLADKEHLFLVRAVDLEDARKTGREWYSRIIFDPNHFACWPFQQEDLPHLSREKIVDSDAYKELMSNDETMDGDSEDDEDCDFECCYDCSQCEINGNCERQEHMSEVDNEVDAL